MRSETRVFSMNATIHEVTPLLQNQSVNSTTKTINKIKINHMIADVNVSRGMYAMISPLNCRILRHKSPFVTI